MKMSDEIFDADAAAVGLTATLAGVRGQLVGRLPAPDPRPLFTRKADGTVLNRAGQQVRGPIEELPAKGK